MCDMSRSTFWLVGAWALSMVSLATSCEDEVSSETGTDPTSTSNVATTVGPGGSGGAGGAPFSCEQCVAPEDICVDDSACAATCPNGRSACHTSPNDTDPSICCDAGDQCCTAAENGYAGVDLCHPSGEACPVACPGGDFWCPADEYCALDAETGDYSCVAMCNPLYLCGSICCPLGSTCGPNDSCVLADLTIDAQHAADTVDIQQVNFQQGSCSFFEGCIGAIGQRDLLRFNLRTPNIGDGDLFLGDPTGNPLFVYSPCHDHFHFEGYANYRLLDMNMTEVASGHKQAFCLLDWEPFLPSAEPGPVYDCGYQGITKGWADTYEASLACQWVDITGVPPGNYQLEIVLNVNHTLGEKDYTNNSALIPVTIP